MKLSTLTRLLAITVTCSLIGYIMGTGLLNSVHAKSKSTVKRTKAKGHVSTLAASCPTIKTPQISLFAEAYSQNQGLGIVNGDSDSIKIPFIVSGLPNGTTAKVKFTWLLGYEQVTRTRTDRNPSGSASIAISTIGMLFGSAGVTFGNRTHVQTSRGGNPGGDSSVVPFGILEFEAVVSNGATSITALIQAGARTSQSDAYASTIIALDLVSIEFVGNPITSKVTNISFGRQCPPDCGPKLQDVADWIAAVKTEYNNLVLDQNDLYCTARILPVAGKRGTWIGHQKKYVQYRNGLVKAIRTAESALCIIPPEAYEWANTPPPDKPSNANCD